MYHKLYLSFLIVLVCASLTYGGLDNGAPHQLPRHIGSFGSNTNGRLGQGAGIGPSAPLGRSMLCSRMVSTCYVSELSVSSQIALATTSYLNLVFAWGSNGNPNISKPAPAQIVASEQMFRVAASRSNAFCIGQSGEIYGWGDPNTNMYNLTLASVPPPPPPFPLPPLGGPSATAAPSSVVAPVAAASPPSSAPPPIDYSYFMPLQSLNTVNATTMFSGPPPFITCTDTYCLVQAASEGLYAWGAWAPTKPIMGLQKIDMAGPAALVSSAAASYVAYLGANPLTINIKLPGIPTIESYPLTCPDLESNITTNPSLSSGPIRTAVISSGQNYTLILCSSDTILAFGDNTYGQLGDGTNNHALPSSPTTVQIPPGVTIVQVAAGALTGYALTDTGDVYGWGASMSNALNNFTTDSLTPVIIVPSSMIPHQYSISSMVSCPDAHGLFLITEMMKGHGCVPLGTTAGSEAVCSIDGYWNLDLMALSNLPLTFLDNLKIRTSLLMNGTAWLSSAPGMVIEGEVTVQDSSTFVVYSNTTIIGPLTVSNTSTLQFNSSSLQIQDGDLFADEATVLNFTGLVDAFMEGADPVINITGNATIYGAMHITLTQTEVDLLFDLLVEEINAGTPIPFAAGARDYLSGPTASGPVAAAPIASSDGSANRTAVLILSSGTTVNSGNVLLPQATPSSSSSCQSSSVSQSNDGNSILLIFSVSQSGCNALPPSNPASPTAEAKKRQTWQIIVGGTVGGVALIAVIVILVILFVKPIRRAILPYRDVNLRRTKVTITKKNNIPSKYEERGASETSESSS